MTTTLFHGGTIWRGAAQATGEALFVRHGVVEALDAAALRLAAEAEANGEAVERVDLEGGFLMKDIALLGISVWTLADALQATRSSLAGSSQAHAT